MTEGEVEGVVTESDDIEIFWNAREMGVNALLLHLAVISGYGVVAFVVGPSLTHSQARFVSAIFVVFACYALWGVGRTCVTGSPVADRRRGA